MFHAQSMRFVEPSDPAAQTLKPKSLKTSAGNKEALVLGVRGPLFRGVHHAKNTDKQPHAVTAVLWKRPQDKCLGPTSAFQAQDTQMA